MQAYVALDCSLYAKICLPEGTTPVEDTPNDFQLPDGRIISCWVSIEVSSDSDKEDAHDMTNDEMSAAGIEIYDVDRDSIAGPVDENGHRTDFD